MRTLLLAALLALLAGDALAQGGSPRDADDERARVLYENGAILYEEGRYEDAIQAWDEAYRLSGRPLFLFNIANALERIGKWDQALEYLNRYRAYAPAEERTVLERRMRNIERRLEDQRADDRKAADERARKDAEAEAARKEEEERRARAEEEARQNEEEEPTSAGPPSGTLVPGIALMGAGAGVLGAGGALSGLAVAAREEAAALCKDSAGLTLCPDTADDALSRDARLSAASDVLFGVGAGVAATGIVLVVVHLATGGEGVAVAPTMGPTGLGIGVQGRLP